MSARTLERQGKKKAVFLVAILSKHFFFYNCYVNRSHIEFQRCSCLIPACPKLCCHVAWEAPLGFQRNAGLFLYTGSPMFRRDGIAVCIYREGHNTTALDEQSDLLLVVRPVLPCLSSMHGIRPPLFVLCADEVEAAVNVMLIYATASKNGLWSKYNLEEP